jgi:hypothetical protein
VLEACIAESRGERVFCEVQPLRLWSAKRVAHYAYSLALVAGREGCTLLRWQNNALRASTFLMSITEIYRRFLEACLARITGEVVFSEGQPLAAVERKAHQTLCLFAGIGAEWEESQSTAALAENA